MGFSLKKVAKVAAGGILGAQVGKLLKGPKVPGAPGFSSMEQELMAKNLEMLNANRTALDSSNAAYNRLTGLYNNDGTINYAAADALKGKLAADEATGKELQDLETQRYFRALRGDMPVSEGLRQEEEEAFRQFRAQMARRGGGVQGTNFNNAFGNSTAANQRLMGFAKTYGLRADEERRAELNRAERVAGAFYTGERATPYAARMGFAGNVANQRAGLGAQYGSLGSMYGAAAQPYQQQRELEYNAQLAKAGAKQAQQQALLGLAGTIGGAFVGGPMGAAAGGRMAQGMGGGGGMGFGQTGTMGRVPYRQTNYSDWG